MHDKVQLNGALRMFGVVLWSDQKDSKAVIWCEDHGDLAFCNESVDDRGTLLDTGDLIQFDVLHDHDMRLARNLRKVSEGAYRGLADTLRTLPAEGPVPVPAAQGGGADIIPLDRHRCHVGCDCGADYLQGRAIV